MNHRAKNFKFDRREFTGALGDIGTLIPVFLAMAAINGMNPGIMLLGVGLLYLFCGFYYKLPIPVQPLKAVAAIAIAGGFSASVVSAAGILMGIVLLLIALCGITKFLAKVFARPVIRGVQFGVGLMLLRTSLGLIYAPIRLNAQSNLPDAEFQLPFMLVVLFGGILIMFTFLKYKNFPVTVCLLGFGITANFLSGKSFTPEISFFAGETLNINLPSKEDFVKAFFLLVIPQLPLTLSNAVVSTKDLAKRYFGEKANAVTEKSLSASMGVTNIFAGLAGGMPVCHGSGGLTGHYSFGARTGGAPIIIGSLCLAASLFFGKGAGDVFRIIPCSILGIMLFYVGLKHAFLINSLKDRNELLIAVAIGAIAFLTRNLAIACAFGMIAWYFLAKKTVVSYN